MHAVGLSHSLESTQLSPQARPPYRSAVHLLQLADRYRWYVLAAIVAIYAAGFNGQWQVEPDSALYLSIARNLALGNGYVYHGQVAHLAYPGWPWMLALTFKIFGVGVVWPAHVVMLLFALAAIALTYRLFLLHDSRPVAVIIAAMVAATQGFYLYAFQLRNDMPFLAGVMAVLAGYEGLLRPVVGRAPLRKLIDWSLLTVGLIVAIVMRPMMIPLMGVLIIAGIWTFLRSALLHRPAISGRAGIAVIITLAAVCLFILLDPRHTAGHLVLGGYEQDMAEIFTHEARFIDTLSDTWHIYIPQITRSLPTICFGIELGRYSGNIVATLLLLILSLALWRRRALWGMWIAATFAVLLFTLPRDRYFLEILPLLAYAWWRFIAALNHRFRPLWGNLLFCTLLTLWVGPNIVRVAGAIINQHQQPFLQHYHDGDMAGLARFASEIPSHVPPGAKIIADRGLGRVLTYLCSHEVLDVWESSQIDPARDRVYCIGPLDVPNSLVLPWMRAHGLKVGPVVLTSPRTKKLPPWELLRLVPQK